MRRNRRPLDRSLPLALLILATLLSGCLGTGKRESGVLFPSDSLSQSIAQDIEKTGIEMSFERMYPARYLSSISYGPDGRLFAATIDTGDVVILPTSEAQSEVRFADGLTYPYLAGWSGDTLGVFSAGESLVRLFTSQGPVVEYPFEFDEEGESLLAYAAYSPTGLFTKALDTDGQFVIRKRSSDGWSEMVTLPYPSWRGRGGLKVWGDQLMSLASHRPVIDRISVSGLDTLSLRGFDSPMLARSRNFMTGDTEEPPILTTSAAGLEDRLFVVNARPGWIRVDVYDRNGTLLHILEELTPQQRSFAPMDVAVKATGSGYEIAVLTMNMTLKMVTVEYESGIHIFAWTPPA